jgi:hypothetical protein
MHNWNIGLFPKVRPMRYWTDVIFLRVKPMHNWNIGSFLKVRPKHYRPDWRCIPRSETNAQMKHWLIPQGEVYLPWTASTFLKVRPVNKWKVCSCINWSLCAIGQITHFSRWDPCTILNNGSFLKVRICLTETFAYTLKVRPMLYWTDTTLSWWDLCTLTETMTLPGFTTLNMVHFLRVSWGLQAVGRRAHFLRRCIQTTETLAHLSWWGLLITRKQFILQG